LKQVRSRHINRKRHTDSNPWMTRLQINLVAHITLGGTKLFHCSNPFKLRRFTTERHNNRFSKTECKATLHFLNYTSQKCSNKTCTCLEETRLKMKRVCLIKRNYLIMHATATGEPNLFCSIDGNMYSSEMCC
jgi:hypothetical protein